MKYNAKDIVYAFGALQELGLANAEEVKEFLEQEFKKDMDLDVIKLVLERLRAKDILSIDTNSRYKIAKIPAPFLSVKMAVIKQWRSKDFGKVVQEFEQAYPQGGQLIEKKGFIHDYQLVTVIFENVDPILGGVPTDRNGRMQVHRNNEGKPVISAGQMYGWFRENERISNLDANAHNHIGFAEAVPTEEVKLTELKAPVVIKRQGGCGIVSYEAFPSGTQFKTFMRIPLKGIGFSEITWRKQLEQYFEAVAVCPKRGLGANSRYYGGRVKLVELS